MRPAAICASQPLPQREFVAYGKLFVLHLGFAGGGLSDEKYSLVQSASIRPRPQVLEGCIAPTGWQLCPLAK